ncbi:MAG: helix-turn-helix domain-containing protein [Nannocystaceae bacterium]
MEALPRDTLDQLQQLAELLAVAIRGSDRATVPLHEWVEQAIVGDGFLARASRAGLTLAEMERAYIRATLHIVGGNKSRAARRLGINRRTLQRRLYGEGAPDARDDDDDP